MNVNDPRFNLQIEDQDNFKINEPINVLDNSFVNYQINGPSFKQDTHILKQDFVFFERSQTFEKDSICIDAYGESWTLILIENPESEIAVCYKGKTFKLVIKSLACFLPPYSIVQWKIPKGTYYWKAYMSEATLPKSFSRFENAFCFDGEFIKESLFQKKQIFQNKQKMQYLLGLIDKLENFHYINKQDNDSQLALKIKNLIEKKAHENFRIVEIAEEMGIHRVYLSRVFKETFGFSPVEYRNHLRVFDSFRRLRKGESVTKAGSDCGFENLTQFHSQFKKILGVSPLEFCISKKIPKGLSFI